MNRRAFLLSGTALAAGTTHAWGQTQGQEQSPQESQDAGRLYNPSVVQQRARSTDYDNDEHIKNIEKQLGCTCGCNLDIYTCRTTDFTCTTSPRLHREVVALHEAGLTAEEILEDFTTRYGEQVLMAPRPEGFNLAGYRVPGKHPLALGYTRREDHRRRVAEENQWITGPRGTRGQGEPSPCRRPNR